MNKKQKIVGLLAAAALLAGCGQTAGSAAGTTSAETVARSVLEELYSAEAQDSADFEDALTRSATDESALNGYLTQKVGDQVSDEGLATLVDNRVVTRVLNAWPASEVAVEEIDLQDAYTQSDDQQFYSYTVTAGPDGEDPQEFTGEIGLTLTDGVWTVSSVN